MCTVNNSSDQGFLQQSHIPIFPFLGMKTVNQFPLMGFFFWINSQKWEQKFQPIPNVGELNSINSQSQMGTKFSTNSQWGEIKFNQFPVLLECQRKRLIQIFQSIPSSGNSCGNQFPLWEQAGEPNPKFGNKDFNQILPVGIHVGINSHFGNKLENQIPNLGTNISINSHQWECPNSLYYKKPCMPMLMNFLS